MKQTTLETITHQVGIDISKSKLDCWLRPNGLHLCCGNDAEGFRRLRGWLNEHHCRQETTVICMEDTGIYGKKVLMALTADGWHCSVEKTTILSKVSPEHHRKEDAFDASLLAEYADRFADQLQFTTPPAKVIEELQQLYSERRRLVRQRTATKTKQKQAAAQPHCPELLQEGWSQQLDFLSNQITRLETQITQRISAHNGLDSYYQLLVSIPGVGQVTAWLWLIMFYGQPQLDPKKIASRFGVAPHSHRSGSSVRGKTRSSGHGASEMRSTMTLAARSASTHCQKFNRYKQRKLDEGKPWPVVRNNLVNKLITIICAIWNRGAFYDPDHQSRFDREKKAA